MSSMTKISLLALIGAAAAHPSYGGHSKFHSKLAAGTGKPYPTGGWSGNYNSTQVPAAGTASSEHGRTSTIDITSTSTTTIYSTIYGTPASQAVVVENVSSKPAGQCGPATVTVTATEKATVTVTPGVSSGYSAGVVSSVVALPSSQAGEYDASSYIVVSSTPAAEKPTSEPVVAPSSMPVVASSSKAEEYTPSASPPAITSVAQTDYSTAVPSSTAPASSSAAPKPSGTPTYSGTKRGLAYNDGELCASLGSGFGFAYNWAQTESKDVGAPFIPMMHKPSDSTAEDWLANVDKAAKAGSTAVMGFNEPDHAEQANMTPEAACSAWMEYMNPIASSHPDITILGPSVTNSGLSNGNGPMGLGWLSRFHEVCPDAIVHATNIHFYDIYEEATIDRFRDHVEKAAADYGKPVWITEFGLNPGSASAEQAASFLKEAMAYCDSSDKVQGYSWFMVGTGENHLNTATGLSALGQIYAGSS